MSMQDYEDQNRAMEAYLAEMETIVGVPAPKLTGEAAQLAEMAEDRAAVIGEGLRH